MVPVCDTLEKYPANMSHLIILCVIDDYKNKNQVENIKKYFLGRYLIRKRKTTRIAKEGLGENHRSDIPGKSF